MNASCWPLGAALAVVVLHLAVYFAGLRDWAPLRREKGIFLYHLASFVAVTGGAGAWYVLARQPAALEAALAAIALHSIYSMSFLELWSLSQIGYSVAMLDALETRRGLDAVSVGSVFARTGSEKKESRLAGLQKIGLVAGRQGHAVLTWRGRIVAFVLLALRRIANLGETG